MNTDPSYSASPQLGRVCNAFGNTKILATDLRLGAIVQSTSPFSSLTKSGQRGSFVINL